MRARNQVQAPTVLALLWLAIAGCSPAGRVNADHPRYGDAEYKTDLSQCRAANSRIVMSSGYDDKSDMQVDEAKVASSMASRGWQAQGR